MPPENQEEVRAWLTKADHDLRAATYLADAEEQLLDIVVYHCQQAAEKALEFVLDRVPEDARPSPPRDDATAEQAPQVSSIPEEDGSEPVGFG